MTYSLQINFQYVVQYIIRMILSEWNKLFEEVNGVSGDAFKRADRSICSSLEMAFSYFDSYAHEIFLFHCLFEN